MSAAEKLAAFPRSGRRYGHGGLDERECLIPFGQFGYSLRYRVDGTVVVILGIKHQREAGY
ncbi:type II toxin-antitoxin system RelE/ParE family toxin [Devosia sp. A16]|uniref:type II toxin-antitoxin system RelE/ParE family toxin n=1 Tax=Devosia sp. A16 TaxID=1736675 RepID=UPI001F328721|nr:type II toxin-antitoxin system RelE/ParE family toxin [Devosia sp. A16]